MGSVKWKTKEEIEIEKQKKQSEKAQKERFKGKKVEALSQKERNELLEQMATDLGYL
jgi:hypothetical protein